MADEFPHLTRMFGLDREQKIADSGIRSIFTPHQPIAELDLLFGRQTEVQSLVETLNTPGQHVLLYGERGVGKSSIANVISSLLPVLTQVQVYEKRCDSSDNFETILMGPLAAVGADLTLLEVVEQSDKQGGANIGFFNGSVAKSVVATYKASNSLSPSTAVEAISHIDGLLIIDEVDALGDSDDRRKIAELVKLLSDAGSPFKIMIVGIARTGDELTAAHPSVHRCLRETKLDRMSRVELWEIVRSGGDKAGLKFSDAATARIVDLSAGYPHFTHLIALKCAEAAIIDERQDIDVTHLNDALQSAVRDAEGTLKREFESAVRSANTGMYRSIVLAAASVESSEFSAASLRSAVSLLTGSSISQGSMNNYLTRLVSDNGASILTRTGKGVYRFTDPRMASFARIHGALEGSAV